MSLKIKNTEVGIYLLLWIILLFSFYTSFMIIIRHFYINFLPHLLLPALQLFRLTCHQKYWFQSFYIEN